MELLASGFNLVAPSLLRISGGISQCMQELSVSLSPCSSEKIKIKFKCLKGDRKTQLHQDTCKYQPWELGGQKAARFGKAGHVLTCL